MVSGAIFSLLLGSINFTAAVLYALDYVKSVGKSVITFNRINFRFISSRLQMELRSNILWVLFLHLRPTYLLCIWWQLLQRKFHSKFPKLVTSCTRRNGIIIRLNYVGTFSWPFKTLNVCDIWLDWVSFIVTWEHFWRCIWLMIESVDAKMNSSISAAQNSFIVLFDVSKYLIVDAKSNKKSIDEC